MKTKVTKIKNDSFIEGKGLCNKTINKKQELLKNINIFPYQEFNYKKLDMKIFEEFKEIIDSKSMLHGSYYNGIITQYENFDNNCNVSSEHILNLFLKLEILDLLE